MAKTKNSKQTKKRELFPIPYEYIFVVVAIIFGILIIYQNPPFHSNDEDRHFIKAYYIAHNGFYEELSDDKKKVGGYLPKNLVEVVRRFQGFPYQNGQKMDRNYVEKLSAVPLNENDKEFANVQLYRKSFWSYLPSAIGIKLAGNSNPVTIGYYARIGSLIFYIIIMFIVIKRTPVFKSVFFLYGLMPMTLYQAGSVTQDVFIFGGTFILFSAFLRYALIDEVKFTWKDMIFLIIILFFMRSAKNGYFLVPAIFYFVPKSKISKSLNYILYIILITFLIFLSYKMNWDFTKFDHNSEINSELVRDGGFKRDFVTNRNESLKNYTSDIPMLFDHLTRNILFFKKEFITGAFGRFGYSYSMLSETFVILNGILLIIVATFSGKRQYNFTSKFVPISISLIGLVSSVLLIFGFLLASPIGAEMVFGFQGRYLIPFVPLILLAFYNHKLNFEYWDKYGSLFLGAYAFIMLGYVLSQMKILFYAY